VISPSRLARVAAYRMYAVTSPWYRRGRLSDYRALLTRFEKGPRADIEAWQLARLRTLLAIAERTSFWPDRLRAAGLSPERARSLDDLLALAVLDKKTIVDAGAATLHPTAPPPFRAGASSGTTGSPMRVRTTAEMDAAARAARWRMFEWFGVPFGAPTLKLAGGNQARDWKLQLTWGFAEKVLGQAFTDAFRNPFEHDLALLRRVRPDVVIGYPNVLVQLTEEARRRGVDLAAEGVRLILLGGETILPAQRVHLGNAFACRVASIYGSHEGHYMATECERGALHVHEHLLLEIVDGDGRRCREGEIGDVVITPLLGTAMPLFRYRLGDRGRLLPPCACGRPFPALSLDLARTSEMVVLRSGRRISSQFIQPMLHHHFGLEFGVDPIAYRVTQTALDRLRVEVQLPSGRPLPDGADRFLAERVRAVVGDELRLELFAVPHLVADRSGKLRCFVPL
jgi:phenylacetate-CoA ligase